MCARTTVKKLPDSIDNKDFDLQKHLDMLQSRQSEATAWSLG
jgi:hypothetical protein